MKSQENTKEILNICENYTYFTKWERTHNRDEWFKTESDPKSIFSDRSGAKVDLKSTLSDRLRRTENVVTWWLELIEESFLSLI
jgi:hypothetical protein